MQVFLSPPAKGETWVEGLWRNCFNTMGRFNFLSRIRRSQVKITLNQTIFSFSLLVTLSKIHWTQLNASPKNDLGKPAKKKVLKSGHCPKVPLALPPPSY